MDYTIPITILIFIMFIVSLSLRVIFKKDREARQSCTRFGHSESPCPTCGSINGENCEHRDDNGPGLFLNTTGRSG